MKHALCLAATVLLIGCGDSTKSEPAAETAKGENPLSAPADYVGAVGQAQKSAANNVNLTPVRRAIQQFKSTEGRNPASLQELVTAGHLSAAPRAPSGMKFQYDANSGAVTLVRE